MIELFFLATEIFIIVFTLYLFVYKKELAIIYIPTLIFAQTVITPVLPAMTYYIIFTLFILYFIYNNISFLRENPFTLALLLYYAVLLTQSPDIESIRAPLFSVAWLLFAIPLIISIYRKFEREILLKELSQAAFIILLIFVVNVAISTFVGYAPNAMYGITTGILYGNLFATDFNVLSLAIFVVLIRAVNQKSIIYFLLFVISFSFVTLSLRRSVMGLAAIGIAVAVLLLLTQRSLLKVVAFSGIVAILGFAIIANTSFMTVLIERYEHRNLAERELEEEKRFLEYEVLYEDMFIYEDYSPWFGYGLFDSAGNYGKGIFEERTLHSDLTNMAHSTGILGVVLYLLMIFTIFWKSYKASTTRTDRLIFFYCVVVFMVYTTTGRYTTIENIWFIVLLLMLPVAKQRETENHTFSLKKDKPALKKDVNLHKLPA
ncbi:O-antigen ligase family protein [uncultured Pontibacter sp.]|uniref:O-antigen ligase family protein n=1 Tax=uncultured Pontibacter sp. TaxID=453356 RepID=UPI002603DB07|nr:O-antigen ligase family protein [uncultured Pontibacter sp.]